MAEVMKDPRNTYVIKHVNRTFRVRAYNRRDVEKAYPGAGVRLVVDGSVDGMLRHDLPSPEVVET